MLTMGWLLLFHACVTAGAAGDSAAGAGGRATGGGGEAAIIEAGGVMQGCVSLERSGPCEDTNCPPDCMPAWVATIGSILIDFSGNFPSRTAAGMGKSGIGISLGCSPAFGGTYMVSGRGMVMVPGGSSVLSVGLWNPLSEHSSVSPSSTEVIIILWPPGARPSGPGDTLEHMGCCLVTPACWKAGDGAGATGAAGAEVAAVAGALIGISDLVTQQSAKQSGEHRAEHGGWQRFLGVVSIMFA